MESDHKDLKIHYQNLLIPFFKFQTMNHNIHLFLHNVSYGQPLNLLGHNEVNLTGYLELQINIKRQL